MHKLHIAHSVALTGSGTVYCVSGLFVPRGYDFPVSRTIRSSRDLEWATSEVLNDLKLSMEDHVDPDLFTVTDHGLCDGNWITYEFETHVTAFDCLYTPWNGKTGDPNTVCGHCKSNV